jgi:hypothetical protein
MCPSVGFIGLYSVGVGVIRHASRPRRIGAREARGARNLIELLPFSQSLTPPWMRFVIFQNASPATRWASSFRPFSPQSQTCDSESHVRSGGARRLGQQVNPQEGARPTEVRAACNLDRSTSFFLHEPKLSRTRAPPGPESLPRAGVSIANSVKAACRNGGSSPARFRYRRGMIDRNCPIVSITRPSARP